MKIQLLTLISLLFIGVVATKIAKANTIEVNAIIYMNGKPTPLKVELTLPNNWYIYPSKTPESTGDYLITKDQSVYMIIRLAEWGNYTPKTYANLQSSNGYSELAVNGNIVFTKEILEARRRFEMNYFIESKKTAISTTLSLYDDHLEKNIDNELKQVATMLSNAKVTFNLKNSNQANPKIASSKKSVDATLIKITQYAKNGELKRFPTICAKVDSHLLKYTFPKAPQEVKDYYNNAKNLCRGKLHTQALLATLNNEGVSVCRRMEVKLQTNRIESFINKTNSSKIWNSFMANFKQLCPNNLNF